MSEQHHIALPAGYRLENYRLEAVLGHGGFGITYRAIDEDLEQTVAIKEYLPRDMAFRDKDSTVSPLSESDRDTFEWGLERFLDEARTLARFHHPNIVGVRRFVRANGTAYLIMDYCRGGALDGVLKRQGTLPAKECVDILVPLLGALEALHAAGVTHRDIKPANIYLRDDGSPVLLDFGAARQTVAARSRSVTALATPGYAACEQYSASGKQGPWTDIYGLAATLYRCVTGSRSPDATERLLEDSLVPASRAAAGEYPKPLLWQIDAGMRVRPEDRPQSVAEWRQMMTVPDAKRVDLGKETREPFSKRAYDRDKISVSHDPPSGSLAGMQVSSTGIPTPAKWAVVVVVMVSVGLWILAPRTADEAEAALEAAITETADVSATLDRHESIDEAFWNRIRHSRNVSDYDDYLRVHPRGRFSDEARERIALLRPTIGTPVVSERALNPPRPSPVPQRPPAASTQPMTVDREVARPTPARPQATEQSRAAYCDGVARLAHSVANRMILGQTSSQVINSMGGLGGIEGPGMMVISYVYGFEGSSDVPSSRIRDMARARCINGAF